MSQSNTQDTLVGLFVAAGIAGLFFLALQVSNLSSFTEHEGFTVTARFENSGGLKVKSPVSAAGVKVGQVSKITFDPKTFDSVVEMRIYSQYNNIPSDVTASIYTAGLLGEQYVGLGIGGGTGEYLKQNSEIEITNSAIILEKAISQFLFKQAEEKK
jgi:phospholipid/cholesterol/gamma-HCH transport system substrate-binding protein